MALLLKILFYFYITGLMLSIILNKEIEETIPFIFISDGIIISFFSYLENVYLGIYFSIFIFPVVLFLFTVLLFAKKKLSLTTIINKIHIRNISILCLFIVAYLLSKNTYISESDEFHLWALRTFDMLKNNSLMTQSSLVVSATYKRYPLLFSSLQCLFCYFGGGYREPLLYFANITFCFSIFLYLIPQIKIKQQSDYYKLILFLELIILSGLCFNYTFYDTLLVDAPMVLLASLSFYISAIYDLKKKSNILELVICILGLLMSKQTCIIFVFLIIIFVAINKIKFNNKKNVLMFMGLLLLLFVLSMIALNKISGLSTFKAILDSLTTNGTLEKEVFLCFFDAIFNRRSSFGILPIPFFYYLVISCIIFLFVNHFNSNPLSKKRNIRLTVILFLGGVIWILAHLYLTYYLIGSEITQETGAFIPGYERYMGTYLYLIVNTLFMVSINDLSYYPNYLSFFIPISLLLCINIDYLPKIMPHRKPVGTISEQETIRRINLLDLVPDDSDVLIIEQNAAYKHYYYDEYIKYYYYIYDMNKSSSTRTFNKYITNENPRMAYYSLDYSLEEYVSYISLFDYIYLSFVDDYYIEKYWKPSTNSELYDHGLYKIVGVKNGLIELQFVSYYY